MKTKYEQVKSMPNQCKQVKDKRQIVNIYKFAVESSSVGIFMGK